VKATAHRSRYSDGRGPGWAPFCVQVHTPCAATDPNIGMQRRGGPLTRVGASTRTKSDNFFANASVDESAAIAGPARRRVRREVRLLSHLVLAEELADFASVGQPVFCQVWQLCVKNAASLGWIATS
jgi:hypothetical protein